MRGGPAQLKKPQFRQDEAPSSPKGVPEGGLGRHGLHTGVDQP